jgi:hypothetical protein
MGVKTTEEYQSDIENYIAARKWYRQRVREGTATDEDARNVDKCRALAVKARAAGATAPPFEQEHPDVGMA